MGRVVGSIMAPPLLGLGHWLIGAIAMKMKTCAVEGIGMENKIGTNEIESERHYPIPTYQKIDKIK